MAIKTVIASGKGGVGKSTVTKSLGLQFAQKNCNVLLIDCDAGLSSLDIMLGVSERVNFTWGDIAEERCTTDDALIKISDTLTLIPSPKAPLSEEFPDIIKKLTDELQDNYDYIFIDAPAGIGRGLARAARGAEKALVTATADEVSVTGAGTVQRVLKENGIKESRLLINRYNVKAAKKGLLLTVDEIIDKTLVQLIGIIPEDKNIMYSTVSEKKLKTKKSDGAFERIAGRISGKYIPLELSQLK
ncbi:MAG: AAA family ATPase [Clostridia bacterium]|nr:AAA family ATPase [Clostridia bacterium]